MRQRSVEPAPWQVGVTRQCLDELGVAAGDAWALWEQLRRARPGDQPAGPEELLALGGFIRADMMVVGATRLAGVLGIGVSSSYDRDAQQGLGIGAFLADAEARTREAQRRRRRGWRDAAPRG